jgi:hypothetical protein
MPTPSDAAAILQRFLDASRGSDIELPRDPTALDTNRLPESSALPRGASPQRGIADWPMAPLADPPPDPAEAAATLTSDPMRANDPLKLAASRMEDKDRLERQRDAYIAQAMIPREGFVPGDPGRRYVDQSAAANAFGAQQDLSRVEDDMAKDPNTGTAEQARVAGINKSVDDAMTAQRPEVADAAATKAKQNAFAEFLKAQGVKLGDLSAAGSPEARAAAQVPIDAQLSDAAQAGKNLDLERAQKLRMSPQLVPGQIPDEQGNYGLPPNLKPLDATEKSIVRSIDEGLPMIGDLKSLLDPTKNAVTDSAMNHLRWGMYEAGIPPSFASLGDANAQKRMQLGKLIEVIGSAPYANQSRNYRFIQDVRQHLTNPLASDAFLYQQIEELEKRWPEIRKTVMQVHTNPSAAPIIVTPGADKFAPPTASEWQGVGGSLDDLLRSADALRRQ